MIINPNNNYMYIGLYDKIGRLNLITGEFNILYITEGIPSIICYIVLINQKK